MSKIGEKVLSPNCKLLSLFIFFALIAGTIYYVESRGFLDRLQHGKNSVTILMKNNLFSEKFLKAEVKKGESVVVVVRNRDEGRRHNFFIPSLNQETTVLNKGEKAILEFEATKSGRFAYLCTLHQTKMTGELEIVILKE